MVGQMKRLFYYLSIHYGIFNIQNEKKLFISFSRTGYSFAFAH